MNLPMNTPTKLTEHQRKTLRSLLSAAIADLSVQSGFSPWPEGFELRVRRWIESGSDGESLFQGTEEYARNYVKTLAEMLGELPVGYRAWEGWAPIQWQSDPMRTRLTVVVEFDQKTNTYSGWVEGTGIGGVGNSPQECMHSVIDGWSLTQECLAEQSSREGQEQAIADQPSAASDARNEPKK